MLLGYLLRLLIMFGFDGTYYRYNWSHPMFASFWRPQIFPLGVFLWKKSLRPFELGTRTLRLLTESASKFGNWQNNGVFDSHYDKAWGWGIRSWVLSIRVSREHSHKLNNQWKTEMAESKVICSTRQSGNIRDLRPQRIRRSSSLYMYQHSFNLSIQNNCNHTIYFIA